INEYIFPDDIYTNPGKFVSIFERFERLCFVGHTHVPGVFLEGPDFYSPDELDYKFELTDEKAIINVGSVGQPRDRDPRSSFVVVYDTYIEFVRLPYDVETPVKKVEQIEELDNFLGARPGRRPGRSPRRVRGRRRRRQPRPWHCGEWWSLRRRHRSASFWARATRTCPWNWRCRRTARQWSRSPSRTSPRR